MNMLTAPAIALLLIACPVSADTTNNAPSKTSGNRAIDPDGLFKSPGFHHVMVSHAGKTIYVAGQAAYDQDMTLIGADSHREQTAQALRNSRLHCALPAPVRRTS